MKKYLTLYLLIFVTAFALLLTLSLTLSPEEAEGSGETALTGDAAPDNGDGDTAGEYRLAAGAAVIRQTTFTLCGHVSELIEFGSLDGGTLESIAGANPDWEIAEFGRSGVTLKRSAGLNCPLHPILTVWRGRLCIYRMNALTLAPELITTLDTELYKFPPNERLRLKRGIVFKSYEELGDYIEAYDS